MLAEKLQDNNAINQLLATVLQQCDDAVGIFVSTIDGLPIQQQSRKPLNTERLSAMASTFISLGDTITGELGAGDCKNIIIENELGVVVLMHINESLILVSVCSSPRGLGMLLSSTRLCAEAIRNNL